MPCGFYVDRLQSCRYWFRFEWEQGSEGHVGIVEIEGLRSKVFHMGPMRDGTVVRTTYNEGVDDMNPSC